MSLEPPAFPTNPVPEHITQAAAGWLARRDRGLTPDEQDEYMEWLAADPRHRFALDRQTRALGRMMQLYEWTPGNAVEPNPDLFAPPRSAERLRKFTPAHAPWFWAGGLGLAAAVAVMVWAGRIAPASAVEAAATQPSFLHVNERLALPDGSRIELNDGAQLVVLYSEQERRVRLTGGEAHFRVWKDPARPFVVEADGVEVIAVGTAFNVRLGAEKIEVLVTEGRVRVQADLESAVADESPASDSADLLVSMGERAVVSRPAVATAAAKPSVTAVSSDEIARELAWQAPRLQFHETRLAEAVAEFNRLNRHQLELHDPQLGELRIGGNFRPDNVEGFVRLLGVTFGIQAARYAPDRTLLSRPQ
jgi:transmembrane sensor